MPQKGAMLLLERILSADETAIQCLAKDHRGPDYPLRIGGALAPLSLVELGAQAAAAHASLFGIGGHHAGLLLALHNVEITAKNFLDGDERLTAGATQLYFDENGARYDFGVDLAGDIILSGQAMMRMEAVAR